MARTTAPLFSLDASGTLAKAVVFSKWRGRSYVRRHAIPKNPQTAAQVGVRAMMKFLSQSYAADKTVIDASFLLTAANANVSAFNAFIAQNMRHWRMGKGPSVTSNPGFSACALTATQALTGGQRNILIAVTPSGVTDIYAIAIFRSAGVITTVNWNNCVQILYADDASQQKFTDAPLTAGTYHYRSAILNKDGGFGAACADASASAT
jgi:hypothetical protein